MGTLIDDQIELSPEIKAQIEEKAKAKAKKQVEDDLKKAYEAQALKVALEELRGKEGMRTGNPEEDRLVEVIIDVGESTDRIKVNGKVYFQAQPYTVPVHVARSLMEIMWRSKTHEHQLTGKPMAEHYRKQRNTHVTRHGIQNSPVRNEVVA